MKDRNERPIEIGDEVICEIKPFAPEQFTLIGEMAYSDGDIALITRGDFLGMPVSTAHLTLAGEGTNYDEAMRLRARYLAKIPGSLKTGSE
jgi:hypothetical protein